MTDTMRFPEPPAINPDRQMLRQCRTCHGLRIVDGNRCPTCCGCGKLVMKRYFRRVDSNEPFAGIPDTDSPPVELVREDDGSISGRLGEAIRAMAISGHALVAACQSTPGTFLPFIWHSGTVAVAHKFDVPRAWAPLRDVKFKDRVSFLDRWSYIGAKAYVLLQIAGDKDWYLIPWSLARRMDTIDSRDSVVREFRAPLEFLKGI